MQNVTSCQQIHLAWDHGTPVNVSVTVSNRSHVDFRMTQACVFVSPGQVCHASFYSTMTKKKKALTQISF